MFLFLNTAFYLSHLPSGKVRDKDVLAYNLWGNMFHEITEGSMRLPILPADGKLFRLICTKLSMVNLRLISMFL